MGKPDEADGAAFVGEFVGVVDVSPHAPHAMTPSAARQTKRHERRVTDPADG